MPLYEYKCSQCGFVFEIFQKITDPSIKKCIRCQGPVKKMLSPPALQFKGSGWYVTDYAAKEKQASERKNKEEAKKTKEAPPKAKGPAPPKSKEE